jgi:GTP diphosphokinase / guanosine-3',5'-bis(diphosphate) 3'-diphosphatase
MDLIFTQKLLNALNYAAYKHRFQRRKGYEPVPYINHPIKVCSLLANCGVKDEVTLMAAILHDTLEDTDATTEEITGLFGAETTIIVLEMTDNMKLPSKERKALQIEKASKLDARTKLIKIADKACNVEDITTLPLDWEQDRKLAYLDWSKKVVDRCRGQNEQLDYYFNHILTEGYDRLRIV